MTKIIMSGANGRMGKVITELAEKDPDAEIVAGIDVISTGNEPYPVFTDASSCKVEADVIIDFSSPKALGGLLALAEEKNMPIVLCTTGYSAEELDRIRDATAKIAILKSGNMSLGINTVMSLLKSATQVFVPAGFDVEIVEQHHNQKVDAPSGTALMLADSVNEAAGGDMEYIFDRSQRREKRGKKELGISAVRGGTIPGIHEVIFAGPDEVIEIRHVAYSRSVFGNGALQAAKYLKGKTKGMYDMGDVIAAAASE